MTVTDRMPPATPRPGSILGTRVTRTEDPGLLTGSRHYLADLPLVDRLHAVFVRSDVAHGVLGAIHVDDAVGMPGVVAVLTAETLGVAPHHGFVPVHPDFVRPPLADGRVRFVGEPIAVVLAETVEQGEDAAATVWADIDPLPAVIDPEAAFDDDAPRHLRVARVEPGPGARRSGGRRPGRRRPRRARALREPTHGGGADGARLCGGRGRRRRAAHVLGVDADAARAARPTRVGTRDGPQRDPGRHAPGRRRVRRQGRHPRRVLGRRRGEPHDEAAGRVGPVAQRRHEGPAAQPGPGAVRRAGLPRRRDVHRPARPPGRRLRRLSDDRLLPAGRHETDVAGHVRLRLDRVRHRRGGHEHHADGRLPRRGAARGDRPRRARRRPGGARARHRSDRDPQEELPRRRRVPLHDDHGQHLRHGPVLVPPRPGSRRGRLRRIARRAAATTRRRRHPPPRDRCGLVRRDHRRRRGRRVRCHRGPRRRVGDRVRRHAVARAGPPDRVRHAGVRPDRHPASTGSRSSTATPTGSAPAAARAVPVRCRSAGRPCAARPKR